MSESERLRHPRINASSVELPPIHNHIQNEPINPFHSPRPRELLPSILSRSPPGRSSTLPPIQRRDKPARPRKSSITKNERKPKHGRGMSKDHARRLSIEGRKAVSAEPASAMGKRWEDLIEAATSANEADSDRDLTPVLFHLFPPSACYQHTKPYPRRFLNRRNPSNVPPSPPSPPRVPTPTSNHTKPPRYKRP